MSYRLVPAARVTEKWMVAWGAWIRIHRTTIVPVAPTTRPKTPPPVGQVGFRQ